LPEFDEYGRSDEMKAYLKCGLVAAATIWLLAGCEGTLPPKDERAPAEVVDRASERPGEDAAGRGVTTQPLPSSTAWQGHPLDDPHGLLSNRVIYFEFDSANIRPEDRSVVEAHAQYLAGDPATSVVLEGHADERGSREYNIGLGERRADAVRRLLTLLGVSDGQVRTVSYGEERPAVYGNDESAWSQNRRVELNYPR
jgi:peptidoglycan-associated lipoprotein